MSVHLTNNYSSLMHYQIRSNFLIVMSVMNSQSVTNSHLILYFSTKTTTYRSTEIPIVNDYYFAV